MSTRLYLMALLRASQILLLLFLTSGFFNTVNSQSQLSPLSLFEDSEAVFGMKFTNEFLKAAEQREAISGDRLSELLALECAIAYEGKETVEGRFFIFFVTEGQIKEVVSSQPFKLRPGLRAMRELVPAAKLEEAFKTYFGETAGISELVHKLGPSLAISTLAEGDHSEILNEKIPWENGLKGIGMAFVPELDDKLEEVASKSIIIPAAVVLNSGQ